MKCAIRLLDENLGFRFVLPRTRSNLCTIVWSNAIATKSSPASYDEEMQEV